MSVINVDITIVGGGIAGLSLACLLAKHTGYQIAIVEKGDLSFSEAVAGSTQRVSAINHLSMNIWQHLGLSSLQFLGAAYSHMRVWDHFGGELDFDIKEMDESCLGWIVENNNIQQALYSQAKQHKAIQWFCSQSPQRIEQDDGVTLVLSDEQSLQSQLLVAADGANSWVREQLGIDVKTADYGHHAIVATVTTEQSHQQTAWQRFLSTGPLAFLPLKDDKQCSIVWSTDPDEAKRLVALSEIDFCRELSKAFQSTLGKVIKVSKRMAFPLTMRHAQDYVVDRCVLVGDAAHTVHPLAGQGLNMAMQDVLLLADKIISGQELIKAQALRQYERARKADNWQMLTGLRLVQKVFATNAPLIQGVVNIGISLIQKTPLLKKIFYDVAAGKKTNLPSWLSVKT
jgi:2-polyprenylphenol 6-hydroxylase